MAHHRVKSVFLTLLAAVSSSIISAGTYLWLAPILAPSLSTISRPAESFPWWAPATVKFFEIVLLSSTTLSNPWDAALVGTIGRAPFLGLLISFYGVPWFAIVTAYVVEIVSLVIPQFFVASSVPPHTPYDDLKLTGYASLLSAIFLSLPLYYLEAKYLPSILVTYFDNATSVKTLPLPYVIALNVPIGYSLQTLLSRYGAKGALVVLSNVLVTGTATLYYGVAGAEARGVQLIDTIWAVSILVSIAATYLFVLRK